MYKKIKLRDLTKEQIRKFDCSGLDCEYCPFNIANCDIDNEKFWMNHKDLYSDKFLDQEVSIYVNDYKSSQLTDEEIIILRNIDKDWNYIVREKNERLYLYDNRPIKENDEWTISLNGGTFLLFPFDNLFNFIKYEDEPYAICELLVENY